MESDSVVESSPLTDSNHTIRLLLVRLRLSRMATQQFAHAFVRWCSAALILIATASLSNAVGPIQSSTVAEIGVPLSDPKFAINAFAHQATKRKQGVYEVYTLTGGCRIFQGAFSATCEKAHIWVDRSLSESQTKEHPRKVIIQTIGNCEVRWSDEQRIQDEQWMGRLFSNFEVGIHVDVWDQPNGKAPDLDWEPHHPVTNAFEWTASDKAMNVQLAAQITNLNQNRVGDNLLRPGIQSPPRSGMIIPNGSLGQSMQIGNAQLGATVLDAGSPELFESIQSVPNSSSQPANVQAFQLPGQVDNGPVPLLGPVALSSPTLSPSTQRIGARSFALSGRGMSKPDSKVTNRPDRGDSVITLKNGIRLKFEGAVVQTSSGPMDLGTVLIEADNAVIWTPNVTKLMSERMDDLPVEVYIEGNVVFQQGQRRIYADRMYYNVQAEYGMILGAEILTPAPKYEGILRLKADVIQQRSRENFLAYSAALTSSRLGVPRYWLQSDRIELSDRSNETSNSLFGLPFFGRTADQTGMQAKARNNFVYIEGLPVLYWPIFNTNVDTSSFYVNGLKYNNDTIFGNQVMVDFDAYQVFGLQGIDGTRWNFSTDYLAKRGFALGTNFTYNVPNLALGPAKGFLDAWGIQDKGRDFIGGDRSNLLPEKTIRGRLLFKHKQYLSTDTELWAEAGLVSDRNFLEQYFEQEWDTQKDYSTALRLRQYYDQQMFDLWGQTRLNRFFTETEWLPRLDHYWLGQSIGDVFTYYSHSDVGYARQKVASTPINATEAAKFKLQPWEVAASGLHAVTRHELNLPIDTGYYKFVPFLSGEAGNWGQDVTGNDITRLTGQAGLKSSLPMWRTFPEVQSSVLNLNGMAHKISFESEFLYADTTRDLEQFPLYNPIDDNSQEHFRRRLVFNTFGGVLPDQFDATKYAARQSMQRYVSAGSSEVVTNQLQSRMGLHQRLQTKRGVAGRERIADVVEIDIDAIFFGKPDRDNFGQSVGGINYDFRYHIGDRVTLISDGYYDLFKAGLKATTLGGVISRPGRGDVYLAVTSLEGPISSLLLTTSFNYRLNEKWVAVGGTSVDLGKTGNIGQSLGLTRIGESFLIRFGGTVDSGRNNVAFNFNLEPRFFQRQGLGVVAGQVIPPAGLYGLE